MRPSGWNVLCAAAAVIAAAACCTGCDTKNVGTSAPPARGITVDVVVPAAIFENEQYTWTVSWEGGVAPYEVRFDFGGGASQTTPSGVVATFGNSIDIVATMYLPPDVWEMCFGYTFEVEVMDSAGNFEGKTFTYLVCHSENSPPRIDAVDYSGVVLTVTVSDADGDDVTVTPGSVPGLRHYPDSVVVFGGSGDAIFIWEADDFLAGGAGTTSITADDGTGATDTADQAVFVPGFTYYEPDTLYVLPTVSRAAVGEPVTLVCITGAMPHPFQFLNGVGVTIEEDADYVASSFNVGMPGGGAGDVDGSLWTAVGPSGFLLADNLIRAVPLAPGNSIPAGRERWSFNLTGLGGSDISGGAGVLFNFEFTFSEPGLKRIGLQAVDGVNRTYYSDSSSTEYFWGTLMADEFGNLNVSGVDNSVLVE